MKQKLLLLSVFAFAIGLLVYSFRPAGSSRDHSAGQKKLMAEVISPLTPTNATKTTDTRGIASQSSASAPTAPTAVSTSLTEAEASLLLQSQSSRAWEFRRDGFGNRLRTLARGSWSAANAANTRAQADAFIAAYAQSLFGVSNNHLLFFEESVSDRTKLTYKQIVNGTEVYGATLNLFFENGELTRVQNDLAALAPTLTTPPAGSSVSSAFEDLRVRKTGTDLSLSENASAKTVLYPGPTSLVYAFEFSVKEVSRVGGKVETFRVLYNAEDHALIKKWATQIY